MTFADADWTTLIGRIKAGACTPFIGAGASHPAIDLASTISEQWAKECGYPLADHNNLARVAQYMKLNPEGRLVDPAIPRRKMLDYLKTRTDPNFADPGEPHGVLARLPLPVYVTTNYDGFMLRALKCTDRPPQREYCRWNRQLAERRRRRSAVEATRNSPLVYHLHGYDDLESSLVLSEDDYIDFIVNVSEEPDRIPPRVQDAMTDNALLFLGYSLTDWTFRVLFRTLQRYLENSTRSGHVSVQLAPDGLAGDPGLRERARLYLDRYFQDQRIVVYWGTCREFCAELQKRWSAAAKATG